MLRGVDSLLQGWRARLAQADLSRVTGSSGCARAGSLGRSDAVFGVALFTAVLFGHSHMNIAESDQVTAVTYVSVRVSQPNKLTIRSRCSVSGIHAWL